jgi:hypothetical protein
MATAELRYALLIRLRQARLLIFIFQKTVFYVRTALTLFLQALLQPPSSMRKDTKMKKMHKMPDGSMMKDSDMEYGGESKKMEYKMGGGYMKKMAKGG